MAAGFSFSQASEGTLALGNELEPKVDTKPIAKATIRARGKMMQPKRSAFLLVIKISLRIIRRGGRKKMMAEM